MSLWTLALRGLRHHWRLHLGVVLGAALGAAVLTGALLVGASVRASLREQALARVGAADAALFARERTFTLALADRIAASLEDGPDARVAPALALAGVASTQGGAKRRAGVQVAGVDERFFDFAPPREGPAMSNRGERAPRPGEAFVNEPLAEELGLEQGDELLVRVAAPSALPREAVMGTTDEESLGLRLRVAAVAGDERFGRFALQASPLPPASVFVALADLEQELALGPRANLVLAGGGGADSAALTARANAALAAAWTLADAQLSTRVLAGRGAHELVSERVFLDAPVADALSHADEPFLGVFTYFVNSIELGPRATPYSMVTGVGQLDGGPVDAAGPWSEWTRVVPPDLGDGGIVLNRWCADDLGAEVGDEITLRYFVAGAGLALVEDARTFRVHSIAPIESPADDPTLMPLFPGLADADHCRDWEAGVFVDLERVRDVDEAYWEEHRGTPKAFVTLGAARAMWASRFGSLTAVRAPAGGPGEASGAAALERAVKERLDPAAVGLFFHDVRTSALAASAPAVDFGGLFLGLSAFLIAAAVLFTALSFALGVEERAAELGALHAMGLSPARVRGLLVREGLALAVAGAALGALLGTLYTRGVIRALGGVWSGAVGAAEVRYHASAGALASGAAISVAVALAAIAWCARRAARRSAFELLGSRSGVSAALRGGSAPRALAVALVAGLCAAAVALSGRGDGGAAVAGRFFAAGALLLVAALAAARALFACLERSGSAPARSVAALGARGATRRPGRSLATVALVASGAFLIVAVRANRLGPPEDPDDPSSGTGGFELFGRTSLPVLHDLDLPAGRAAYGLDEEALAGASVLGLRARDGDDASCLNLGTPSEPRLVGVDGARLAERGAFSFASVLELPEAEAAASPWELLALELEDGALPAIGDQASVRWTMKKALGDELAYVDERGRAFRVRIVATLSDSILQGDLVVDEERLKARFPSESGKRVLLIDAPPERVDAVSAELSRGLADLGLELTPAAERLAGFHAVQNTYLAILQVLGALGLLLGCAALGVLVLRSALERRGELGALAALGFERRALRRLVVCEHGLLLVLGLACGTLPALLAVLPVARGDAASPLVSAGALGAGLGAAGFGLAWLAASVALRGRLTDGLRND